MPLPGGASDKLGNRYELWWTVSQFVRVLHGQAEAIRIEDPGVTHAEFVISSGGTEELHQAKRNQTDGRWSLASLGSPDVQILQGIFKELSGNNSRFVFVSGSDARELAELADRARDAATLDIFESQFLSSKEQARNFEKLRRYWNDADAAVAYELLQRVEVRTVDERSLVEQVQWGVRALFLAEPNSVCAELRKIAQDSIHKSITRDELIGCLHERGFRLRRLIHRENAPTLVKEATKHYLDASKKRLIRKSIIPRAATASLVERLTSEPSGGDTVLVGKAGSGKTGCLVEFVDTLNARPAPPVVFAFRLDRLDPVSTTADLGKQLGLEESPVIVLAGAIPTGGEGVLVIDQLDAVSTTSGRSSDFFETVEGLLAEAKGLRGNVKLHVIVACRAFDWENDHRLRRMLSEQHAKVEVTEFSIDAVKVELTAAGFRLESFQPNQLKLMQLAQNLSLFLEGGFDPASTPIFRSAKELLDRYWNEKRRAVAIRASPAPDQWNEVIQLLVDEMTRTQQLSVAREKLDRFSSDYVSQMGSEGVLTTDGDRYGFDHESFFDYCFARLFVVKDQPLVEFLTASEQHLFRRAQVRQVLSYLRDADRSRYCNEFAKLLGHSKVRMHIKDLALAIIVDVPDPGDDEWSILEPFLSSVVTNVAMGQHSSDKLNQVIWRQFFGSTSWFHLADKHGWLVGWLASDNSRVANMGVNYLRFHQRHAGDRVAELLQPYVGNGGEWSNRLRFVMEWADHENSRKFFELFLRLIDDGTLDEARDRFASNGTFWSMLYGLGQARPEWIPEVLTHWLRRRFLLATSKTQHDNALQRHELFNGDEFGVRHFHESAKKAPATFVEHVLPVVLEITDSTVHAESQLPKRDSVWSVIFISQYESPESACLNSLVDAVNILAAATPEKLNVAISELERRNTYTSNLLLLNAFTAGATYFANEAATILSAEPWRLHCGYSDSPYWIAKQLIAAIVPLCAAEGRAALESVILNYSPDREHGVQGRRLAGAATFALLAGFPEQYRSANAIAQYKQLERKFGEPDSAPQGIRVFEVVSPIEKQAAEKMSDEQWLKAIAKYASPERSHYSRDPAKGGASHLAATFRDFVVAEPERFGQLSLKFPVGTNPLYIERTLDGLKNTAASTELKLNVCRKAFSECPNECSIAIADMLGSIKEPLPDDAISMLSWLATEHRDPEKELWAVTASTGQPFYGGDMLTHGINTTRGRAAGAIADLISESAKYIPQFRSVLKRMATDTSLSVRACAASAVLAIANHDWSFALSLFQGLTEPLNTPVRILVRVRRWQQSHDFPFAPVFRAFDRRISVKLVDVDRLFATRYVDLFIYHGLNGHFRELRPFIEQMLRSSDKKTSGSGARLACLAAMFHKSAMRLADEALAGIAAQRLGVAQVASANIGHSESRMWCETTLLHLFTDEDEEVRREAASCFRYLEEQPLESYESLIQKFCESDAYKSDSFSLLHVLEKSLSRLPGITSTVCDKFLARFGDEASDVRTSRAGDAHMVANLIFRTYHQHRSDEWASPCLDLIDRMCGEGIHEVKGVLEQFER